MMKTVIVILVICTSHGFLGVAGGEYCAEVQGQTNGMVTNIQLMDKDVITSDDLMDEGAPSQEGFFMLSGCVTEGNLVTTFEPYLKITCANSKTTTKVANKDINWMEGDKHNKVGKLPKNFKVC